MDTALAPQIQALVEALQAQAIPVIASHSGDPADPDHLLPWIDVAPADPDLQTLEHQERALVLQAQHMYQQVTHTHEHGAADPHAAPPTQKEANALYRRLHELQWRIRIAQVDLRQRLACHLACFYQERRGIAFDQRLILVSAGVSTRLQSQGAAADLFLCAPTEEILLKLHAYRNEMALFAAFLRQQGEGHDAIEHATTRMFRRKDTSTEHQQ